jgi:hypothetical protein
MDVSKSFRFVKDDTQWLSKLLIGVLMSVLSFLILPALILQGYVVKIIRHVMGGNRDDLPEWDDYGKLLKDGFFVVVAEIIYTLPFIILMIVGFAATGGMAGLADRGSDLAAIAATGGGLMMVCLTILFIVALLFLMPAILIQYAIKDDFGALFRFGEVFDIVRNHTADILIVFLVSLAATMAFSLLIGVVFATIILIPLAILLILAVSPYISYVTGHLYGQIAAKVLGNKAGGALPGMA